MTAKNLSASTSRTPSKRTSSHSARNSAWKQFSDLAGRVAKAADALQSPALLIARCYVGWVFFASGLTKIRDWDTTLALFADEYKVPLLSPALAAVMGTAGELLLPVLLVLGLGSRFAALGLSVVNVVAVIALTEIAPAALQQHILWGVLLAGVVIFGGGALAVERLLMRR
jgi:putative oxidoreductase